ncbi:MAG: phytanoyl-CoA dioxygenase family protein [Planctomycetota bacterium]|nr:MAG: phytanoyl-CoA dioxygenase family protein [Planctomycetota bacterium]
MNARDVADPESCRRRLTEDGYFVLHGHVPKAFVRRLCEVTDALFAAEGDRAGWEFKREPGALRLANLVDKHEVFWEVIADAVVLRLVALVLGDRFKLSSLNARAALPGCGEQPLHTDMGGLPDERGSWVCNAVWLLDDFTERNGTLRVIPGSHRWGRLPGEVLADPAAPHPDQRLITAEAGSVVVFDAHLWHSGTRNQSDDLRRALHAFYCRWDKPQQQYQKALLRADTQRRLPPELRRLLALDDPCNDRLSRAVVRRSGFLE